MSVSSKFLFDTEFGSQSNIRKKAEQEPEAPPAIYTEEDKNRLCEEAYQSGATAGKAEALQDIEASTADVLNSMASQLQVLGQHHSSQIENIRCEAASLAFAVAKKLANALISRQPEEEVLKMVESCLEDLHDEPRIVLRASEPVCDALADKINELTQASGFQGKVILLSDDTKTQSNCRIEWADGGVERELTDTEQKLEEIVNRFISTGSAD
ncbi:FliH/SctL family protein [Sneathiella glossodoripedis]|uniref:FliH/SctL family protein n=1 Tax=Sneathiella glossodoripedis TaxID=418853 RepID=UPI00046F5264|nr:FliH/SctL family protein [Sneathiella glossodoripedis]